MIFIKLIVIVTLLFFVQSCKNLKPEDKPMEQISYLALGDSYTIGQGVAENQRYPVQLKDSLNNNGISIEDLKIIARTGWTTDELWNAIENDSLTPPYSMVSLLIGVNNQYRGRDINNYRDEFVNLLNRAIELAGGTNNHVIVISIPDWGVTPFAQNRDRQKIAEEIDAFNAVNREEAEKAGVIYVDVTPISRLAASQPELLASDGLHPSGEMYKLWVKEIYPIAKEILK
jgi:lysophospholipase L1-like esterase